MDIEVVREIIDAFSQVGGEAKEAMIWYLVITELPKFLIGVAWTGIGGVALWKILGIVRSFASGERLRHAAGVSYCWDECELRKAEKCLREHYRTTRVD